MASNERDRTIDVALFAGGHAGSMRPITEFMPKSLLPLGNKPLLLRIIENLSAGLRVGKLMIVCNRFEELIAHYVRMAHKAGDIAPPPILVNLDNDRFGSGGALRRIRGQLGDDVLVYFADVLAPALDYRSLLEMHFAEPRRDLVGTLAVSHRYRLDTGYVETNGGGEVTAFHEKPDRDEKLKNMGIGLFRADIADFVDTDRDSLYGDVVPRAVQRGRLFRTHVHDHEWFHFQHGRDYHFQHVVRYRDWLD